MLVLFSMMPQTDKIQVYIGVNFLLRVYVFNCGRYNFNVTFYK